MRRTSLALAALLLVAAGPADAIELRLLDRFEWAVDDPDFGGFSGLAVTDAGGGLWAVSDRGTLWHGAIGRDGGERISGIAALWHDRFLDGHGKPVSGFTEDSESLVLAPDGQFYVGYESYTRVTGLHPPDMRPEPLHPFDRFKDNWNNEGFEGLARRADGTLLAVIEGWDDAGGGHPTYLGRDRRWRPGPVLRGAPGFGASDAAFDEDGTLWLLERRLTWLARFEVRISTCPFAEEGAVDCREVMRTAPGTLGNMEGLALWRDAGGRRFLSLISDDNFSPLASTVIVEYEILP